MKRKISILGTLFFLFTLMLLCPVKVEAAKPSTEIIAINVGVMEQKRARAVVDAVNEIRAEYNLKPLILTKELEEIAFHRAVEICANYDYVRPTGKEYYTVFDDAELDYEWCGENIAMDIDKASEVVEFWMSDQYDAANILDPDFTHIGVGCFEAEGIRYWVQSFASDAEPSTRVTGDGNNDIPIEWAYEIDTDYVEGCQLIFAENESEIVVGEKGIFDLALFDSYGYILGMVYTESMDIENGAIVIDGSDCVTVKEQEIIVSADAKPAMVTIVAKIGDLTASKKIKLVCEHKNYTTDKKESTCKDKGYEKKICTICEEVIEEKTLPLLEHAVENTTINPAGFGTDGSITGSCKICEEVVETIIPAVVKPVITDVESVVLKDTAGRLLDSSEYTVTKNEDSNVPGTYTITITLKGNYSGTETVKIHVLPDAPEDAQAILYKSDNDIRVRWDEVDNATGYDVYYKKSNSEEKIYFASTTALEIVIPELEHNTRYDFYVYSYYEVGAEKVLSKEPVKCSKKTMKNLEAPKNVKASLVAHDDIKLTWDGVKNADRYVIFYSYDDENGFALLTETTELEYVAKDLRDGKKYTFQVLPAYKDNESDAEYSHGIRRGFDWTEVSEYTLIKPDKPTIEKISASEISLSWDSMDGATGYYISKSIYKTGTNTVNRTIYTSKTYEPTANKTYYYKIRPYKTVDGKRITGPWSEPVEYNLKAIGKASNVSAFLNGGHDDVKVTWSKASGANGYLVYMKSTLEPEEVLFRDTTKLYLSTSNLRDGVKYTFRVVPVYKIDGEVVSEGKDMSASVYTLKKLDEPTITKGSSGKVKVTWDNISGETGYKISRSSSKNGTYTVLTVKTTVKESAEVSATKGKTYYYKVRAYKVINGKTAWGPWSDPVKFVR